MKGVLNMLMLAAESYIEIVLPQFLSTKCSLINGIIAGMAASGLYSAGSALLGGATANKTDVSDKGETHEDH